MSKLPIGWIGISLENITLQVIGGDWGVDPKENADGYTLAKVIKGTDFKFWRIEKAKNASVRLIKQESLIKRKLEPGNIVLEVSGGGPDQPVGRTVFIDDNTFKDEEFPIICSNFFRKLTISKYVAPAYVQYFLEYAYVHGHFDSIQSHTTNLRNLKVKEFLKANIPLPTYKEQNLIVQKINLLLGKLDEVMKRLERIPEILRNVEQMVLTSAATGELTEDWRNDRETESAAILLEKIVAHRKEVYEIQLENFKNNIGVKPRKLKLDTLSPKQSYLHAIPDSWIWAGLLNIAEVVSGVTKGRKLGNKQTIELPYLRVANVQDGYLNLKDVKTIEVPPSDLEKYRLIKGDILFTEGGDRDKLGRGTVWNNEIETCIHQNHIIRARVDQNFVNPRYISFFTKSKVARKYFYDNANQTVNLASISLNTLSYVPIALPPLEEQNEIVRRIEQQFRHIETVEARYKQAMDFINGIKSSIYERAFTGILVKSEGVQNKGTFEKLIAIEKLEFVNGEKSNKKINGKRLSSKTDNIMEIIEALNSNGGSMRPFDLWKATKYANNIEEFYSALKIEIDEKKSVKENSDKSLLQVMNYENR